MRKRILLFSAAVVVLAGAIALAFLVTDIGPLFSGFSDAHRAAKAKIVWLRPERLNKFVQDSQRLAAAQPNPDQMLRQNDIPSEFRDLAPTFVIIGPDKVIAEFVGGLDHVGLEARREKYDIWRLYQYDDGGESLLHY
jgi:hypothetical protein